MFATICWACSGLDVGFAVDLPSVVFFFENLWACRERATCNGLAVGFALLNIYIYIYFFFLDFS